MANLGSVDSGVNSDIMSDQVTIFCGFFFHLLSTSRSALFLRLSNKQIKKTIMEEVHAVNTPPS